jgi:parallel beta-helix repeat protein
MPIPTTVDPGPFFGTYTINVRDYGAMGNGTNDDAAAIQLAINAVQNASGGIVFFPPGTYLHNASEIVVSGNNITLEGTGRASIIKNGTSNAINGIKILNSNRIIIKDLAIDGNRAGIANPPTIGTLYTVLNAIYITGSSDITIDHCYVHDHYDGGILADTSNTLIITNNYVANGNDNGIFMRTLPTTGVGCNDITISNNICTGMSFSGIQAIYASYVTISNNVCYSNGPLVGQGDGVGVEGCSYVTISNNVCYSNGIQGVCVRYSNETPSAVNTVCSHVTVFGNVCYNHTSGDGDAGGIVIAGADDVTIMGNLCYGNSFGITLIDGNGLPTTNVFLGDNIIRSNSNIGLDITTTGQSTLLIANNFIANNANHNCYSAVRVWIQGGIFAGATGSHCGISLDSGAAGSVIDGAAFFDNTDNGILINGGANYEIRNCFVANVVGTNQGRALYEAGGAGPTVMTNNRIKSQANQPYFFSNAASRYYDHQNVGTFTVTTATYTAISTDENLLCNRAGTITITIPNPANMAGRPIIIKDASGAANTNNITVTGAAGNIDGVANKVINTAYGVLRLTTDRANWFTV